MNLTDKAILNAKPRDKEYVLADGGCLHLRIYPTGKKLFEFRYRLFGKQSKIRIGSYPEKTLKAARDDTHDYRKLVDEGKDPKEEKRKADAKKQEADLEKTIQGLYDDWMESYIVVNRKRPEQVKELMEADVLPFIKKIKANEIKRCHIVEIIGRIVKRGAKIKADKVLSLIKQMFSHGTAKGFVEHHPCPDLQRKHFGIKTVNNQRYLEEKEIIELFNQLPDSGLLQRAQYAIIVLLATAQRTGELRQARWTDIDFDNRLWTIPAEHSKTDKAHKVHISDFALVHLKKLQALSFGDYLLESTRKPDQPIEEKTLSKQLRDRQRKAPLKKRTNQNIGSLILSGGEWRLHNLRHTAHTCMGGLGIPPYIVEKILNHTLPGVMAVYNYQDYLSERKDALNQWGEYLDRLQNANLTNVVSMNRIMERSG